MSNIKEETENLENFNVNEAIAGMSKEIDDYFNIYLQDEELIKDYNNQFKI